eukprot:TRINITY_DN34719_c0_g1_i1.p1 TRINITY_DN34719_c0_g1~~TRINITY_DN34719_c0_g1_i1.p1  ORF type:complete len:159 (+),score=18.82 TRINITY_DN34719_c0_g1_i1:294-770(+)
MSFQMHSGNFPNISVLIKPLRSTGRIAHKAQICPFVRSSSGGGYVLLHKLAAAHHSKPPTSLRASCLLAAQLAMELDSTIRLTFEGRPGTFSGHSERSTHDFDPPGVDLYRSNSVKSFDGLLEAREPRSKRGAIRIVTLPNPLHIAVAPAYQRYSDEL